MDNKPSVSKKGRYGLQYRGVECLNCKHPLDISDRYCPSCSQANSTKKLRLKDFFEEFFSSLISYDSRLLKTLSALLTRPGKITKDYVSGKRVSYTNPFRFLLSLAIIYFLMVNFSGDFNEMDKKGAAELGNIFGNENIVQINTNSENKELNNWTDSLKVKQSIKQKDSILLANANTHFVALNDKSVFDRITSKREFFNSILRNNDTVYNFNQLPRQYNIKNTRENNAAFNAAKSLDKFIKQPGSFLSNVISRLPFTVFFFLPVFAFFIWMAYIRKKHTYTEHLVFSFHIQSLLFILLIISFLVDTIFDVSSNWIFLIIFSIYLFLAMRKFYQQGIFKTIVKYVFLNTIFIILALFTVAILFAGSIFTY